MAPQPPSLREGVRPPLLPSAPPATLPVPPDVPAQKCQGPARGHGSMHPICHVSADGTSRPLDHSPALLPRLDPAPRGRTPHRSALEPILAQIPPRTPLRHG